LAPKGSALALAIAAIVLGLGARAARAGGWHRGESLVCSDCHTMHNSEQGASMRYDDSSPANGAPVLLRAANVNALCTHCHDGSVSDAPDVMGEKSAGYEAVDPAGGAFPSVLGVSTDHAHDLGLAMPVTPPDGDTAVSLSCATCHDPHGNANYRNLQYSPSGANRGAPLEVKVASAIPPNGTNPADAYASANLKYVSGMTQWCLDCHNLYDEATSHPGDRTITGSVIASYDWWSGQAWENRVRVQSPTDPTPTVPSPDDRVFCLSCHKAHGSRELPGQDPNPRMLIYADGLTIDSTCIQCHDM
jgi:hypothetical protein